MPIMGMRPIDKSAYHKGLKTLDGILAVLEQHMAGRTFLVGQTLSLADLLVAVALVPLYTLVCDLSTHGSPQLIQRKQDLGPT